jgi:very-short-patch-repair endonuclease
VSSALGYTVLRFTYRRVVEAPEDVAALVGKHLDA